EVEVAGRLESSCGVHRRTRPAHRADPFHLCIGYEQGRRGRQTDSRVHHAGRGSSPAAASSATAGGSKLFGAEVDSEAAFREAGRGPEADVRAAEDDSGGTAEGRSDWA